MPLTPWLNRRRAGLLLLLGMGIAIGIMLWQRSDRGAGPTPEPYMSVLSARAGTVAPGIYLLGESAPSATYVIETSEGLALIDTGMEASAAKLLAQFAQLGLDAGRLKIILLTHVHGDHSLGAAYLRKQSGAKIYAGRGDCKPLRDGGPAEAFFGAFQVPGVNPHPTSVDVELVGDESIALGDAKFTAIAAPGHTPGSVCYLMEKAGLKALFTGDVVQCLAPPGKGAIGTYALHQPGQDRANAPDYLATLRRLRALPVPDLVLPGHPRLDPVPQSPRLSQAQWHKLLDGGIKEIEELLERLAADGADFLNGEPKELLPGLHYLGDFEDQGVYCLRAPSGLYVFDAPGGPEFVDFLMARFDELDWELKEVATVILTSADPAALAGVHALVQATNCKVVAPEASVEAIRRQIPADAELMTAEDFARSGLLELRTIPLSGRGRAPQAYLIRWADKRVLISGRMPVRSTPRSTLQLLAEVLPGRTGEYLKSLEVLQECKPDLWLPALPVGGQNANLYGGDWERILEENRRLFR